MANMFMRFPGGRAKALTLSYDDAVIQDIRLMGILKEHGLKCTFNINTGLYADRDYDDSSTVHRRMTKERAIALYRDSGFEVAVHALTHAFLEQLAPAQCSYEIIQDKMNIERDYGIIARGMAYPYGTYSPAVKQVLADNGIAYARTVNATGRFDIPRDWLELYPTCHHADERQPHLTDMFVNEKPGSAPWLYYMWGHSYEFDFQNNWNIIEEFADKVSGHDDIWYATNIEVYDYVKAFNSMVFSTDMSLAYNPTAFELWFEWDGRLISVATGETARL